MMPIKSIIPRRMAPYRWSTTLVLWGGVVIRVNLFVRVMCRDMVILLGSALEPLLPSAPDVSQLAPKWTATKEFLWNSLQEEISPPIPLQSSHLEYHLGRHWLPPRDRNFLVMFCYTFSKALIWGRFLDVKSAHLLSSVVHLHLRGSRRVSGAWATFLIPTHITSIRQVLKLERWPNGSEPCPAISRTRIQISSIHLRS